MLVRRGKTCPILRFWDRFGGFRHFSVAKLPDIEESYIEGIKER
jgi:hypothetical protein